MHYTVVVEYDPDDDAYNVSVPALPGCYTFGDTLPEALENAADAIAAFLDVLRQDGKPVPVEDVHPRAQAIVLTVAA